MEINLNNNAGVRRDAFDANVNKVGFETSTVSRDARLTSSLEVTTRTDGLVSAEPIVNVPESELRRDDALGKLVNSVFDFKAPPFQELEKNLV